MSLSLFITLPSEADLLVLDPSPIPWNAHDDEDRQWHGRVPYTKKVAGFVLTWRDHAWTSMADAKLVGYFLLYMECLRKEKYLVREKTRDNTLVYRLRIVHSTGAIWIQARGEDTPSLFLAPYK